MKNAKRMLAFGLLLAALSSATLAAGFKKSKTYTDSQFSDVSSAAWYADEVKSTYELGLMNGIGDGQFDPEGNVTVAEAITMASRANAIYAGTTVSAAADGEEWYTPYVNYAVANGLMTDGQFDSYDRPAKRYEVAVLFENAMPNGYFTQKNTVSEIPDVSESRDYADELLTLYRAGVVMGSDSYGNFHPEDNITRAEAAAIINRVALPENRLEKALDVYSPDNAYMLVYNDSFDSWGGKEGINSGWKLDNRGGSPRTNISDSYGSLADVSTEYGTAMIREFNNTTTGLVRLEAAFSVSQNSDGIYMDFRNKDGAPVYRLEAKDHAWTYLNADGSTTDIYTFADGETVFSFVLLIDLDNNRSTTEINGKDCGTYPLATSGKATNLQNYRYGTTEESTGVIRGTAMSMVVNYPVYESNFNVEPDSSKYEVFRPVSGIAVAESAILLKNGQSAEFHFMSGASPVASFTADDKNFYVNGQTVYENYVRTVMYTFRLEMDTETQSITVRVNGRIVAEVPFASAATSIDNYTVANRNTEDTVSPYYMRIFEKKIADDYVPEPVKPKGEEKYNVGINICSLWRNGMHSGWACITPYDDIRPVLGYYDEGNPETADWEIKYMVEHGIDFQAFCWFPGRNTVPIDVFSNDYHLKDGYMNAEYSYMMKYCLIWEAAAGAKPTNLQQWKDFFVPCLIEHYFKDERYMTIDNKLLLYVFTPDKLYGSGGFNSVETCREALDYLEEEVKKLGFDGMIYIGSNAASGETLLKAGFDATSAYNWGTDGYKLETNKNRNLSNAQDTNVFTIPTISVGFNSVGWGGTRCPLMTAADMKAAATWARDEFSPKYAEEGTWQENLYMLSTWNEYGEGTYIMPSEGLNGFGYLDAVRSVFTDEAPNSSLNTIPSASQLKRINRMYPQHQKLLRKNGDYVKPAKELDLAEYETVLTVAPATHPGAINPAGMDNFSKNEDGSISGTTNSPDNYLAFGNGNSLDLSKATLVKITAKLPVGKSMRMYFTTQADQTWNEAKALSASASETDDFAEYLFDFSENKNWTGTMMWYRIDPTGSSGDEWAIQSIEFLGTEAASPEEVMTLTVGETTVDMKLPPAKAANGDYLIAFDMSLGLEFLFNTYCTWDDAAQTLTIEGCGHTVKYVVGKSNYYLDGKEKALGYTMYLFDGLPMIPLKKFCEDMGYTYEMTENGAVVTTTEKQVKADFYAAKESRTPYSWEFNVNGDNEGWTCSAMTLLTADGYMSCKSTSSYADPALSISITPFEAERYTKIAFRVRYEYTPTFVDVKDEDGNPTGETEERFESLTMYFATNSDNSLSEGKTIKLRLKDNSSHGEWEEYEAEIENSAWKDKITQLRFDPFNAVGKIDIDYIRILEDPEYEAKQNAPKPFTLVNPTADESDKVGFISHNANISIVMDPIDGDDKCYAFIPKNNEQSWTYAMQDVYFTDGATYLIEYDIAYASLGTDTAIEAGTKSGSALCNFQYGGDHVVDGSNANFTAGGEWVHVSVKHTVSLSEEGGQTKGRFTVFSNPSEGKGVGFYLDNVKVTEILPNK